MPLRFAVVVSDSDGIRRREIVSALATAGARPASEVALDELPGVLDRHPADLLVVGTNGTHAIDALSRLSRVRAAHPRLPVLVIVSEGSEQLAVAALRAGVTDYLRHPSEISALPAIARRLVDTRASPRATNGTAPAAKIAAPAAHDPLIGSTSAMREVCDYLDRVSGSDATVLITGETGTGKELAAQRIHEKSRRRHRRFVPVNCAAIPDGLLESELFGYEAGAFTGATRAREGLLQQADGGTIFLDEVADLGLAGQAKILRAIETRQVYRLGGRSSTPVDVRVVAATNQDLELAVEEQRFRKDLYFRLNVARVHLPPLRERRSDIPALVDYYLRTLHHDAGVAAANMDPRMLQALVAYDWPGNVRELKNLVAGLLAGGSPGCVRVEDLPPLFRARLERFCGLPDGERRRIVDALFAARWNKSRAAAILHWSRMTLYRKMAKHHVSSTPSPGANPKPRSA